MRKVFKLILVLAVLSAPLHTFAQNGTGSVVFLNKVHDFGNNIPEKGGKVTHRFVFENKGNAPVTVQDVTTSCGCTTPGWSKEPIAPGAKGYVDATYSPLGRPGAFSKSLTVTTNGDPKRISISIRGTVVTPPPTIEEEFPIVAGDLRISETSFSLGRIKMREVRQAAINVYNSGKEVVEISFKNLPSYITVNPSAIKLNPKERASIALVAEAHEKMNYGTNNNKFELLIKGRKLNKQELEATIIVLPNTVYDSNKPMPRMQFNNSGYVFTNVKSGTLISNEYKFTNTGLEDLKILAVNPKSPNINVEFPEAVKPGKDGSIKLSFKTKGLKGVQHFNIEVITNDPATPIANIVLRGNIIQ